MNPIVQLAASALPGEKKYILIAGAGVSKDAGVPTAWDLMLKTASLLYAADAEEIDPEIDLESWFIKSDYAKLSYSELIEKIYPNYPDQQSFLKDYLDNQEVGQAHRAIAELARREIIRAIVTTNFDHYIEKALKEIRLNVQVISTDEDLQNSEPLIHCKAVRIYKPHGNLGKGVLRNTPADLENLSPLMEQELIKILNEHGVLVLGYSGRDKGMQKVFHKRKTCLYPIFWVNPNSPKKEIENILTEINYIHIPCTGASQFIEDFIIILERLNDLAPVVAKGPTIADLRYAFQLGKEPVAPLYADFFQNMYENLEKIRPDFSKFNQYDDAIVSQIENGLKLSHDFIEVALMASRYRNLEALKQVYDFFSHILRLYDVPSIGIPFKKTDFDGYKYIGFEMFVSFIAASIKYGNWQYVDDILSGGLLVEKTHESRYESFLSINCYVTALDDIRNNRLKLNRWSIMADTIKERFTKSELSRLISHKDFIEADYFLFMRTVCHTEDDKYLFGVWNPRSCVYLSRPPSYIIKAISSRFLDGLTKAAGFNDNREFVEKFKNNHVLCQRFFSDLFRDPLEQFDLDKIGTCQ